MSDPRTDLLPVFRRKMKVVSDGTAYGTHIYYEDGGEMKYVRSLTIRAQGGREIQECEIEIMPPILEFEGAADIKVNLSLIQDGERQKLVEEVGELVRRSGQQLIDGDTLMRALMSKSIRQQLDDRSAREENEEPRF